MNEIDEHYNMPLNEFNVYYNPLNIIDDYIDINNDNVDFIDEIIKTQIERTRLYTGADFSEYEIIEEEYNVVNYNGNCSYISPYKGRSIVNINRFTKSRKYTFTRYGDLWLGIRINIPVDRVYLEINEIVVDELYIHQDGTYRLTNPVPMYLNPSPGQIWIKFYCDSKEFKCYTLFGKFTYDVPYLYGCVIKYSYVYVYYLVGSGEKLSTSPISFNEESDIYTLLKQYMNF
jgi:hypothetical protein